jgi:hypothetical protein
VRTDYDSASHTTPDFGKPSGGIAAPAAPDEPREESNSSERLDRAPKSLDVVRSRFSAFEPLSLSVLLRRAGENQSARR